MKIRKREIKRLKVFYSILEILYIPLELRRLCHESAKIPEVCRDRLDDAFLVRFLRSSKFELDRALTRLENYFQLQIDWPENFGDFRFETIKPLLEDGMSHFIESRRDDGIATIAFRGRKWDYEKYPISLVYRAATFVFEYCLLKLVSIYFLLFI